MTRCLAALGACVIALAVTPAGADAVAREPQPGLLSTFAPALAQCSAFRIGLTPETAERERREEARQAIAARQAQKTALELRAYVLSTSAHPHTGIGTPAHRRSVSAAELVQASARLGRNATAAVVAANEELNATSERRYYFYDPDGRLIAETEATTASRPRIQYEYIWFAGEPLVQIEEPESTSPIITYYFTDHLGTPILQTDESAEIAWQAEYDPYGGIHAFRRGEAKHQPLRFPGQIADVESPEPDVYYNVHRYYRASWGRYTQADPLDRRGDPHPYLYALGNPLRFTDPTGERSRVCCTPIASTPPLSYFNHCFVQMIDDNTGATRTFSLHNMGGGWGCTFVNDPFDVAATKNAVTPCGPWNEECGTDGCVAAAHQVYPSSTSYSYLGPNSNTFASTVASQCGLQPPTVPLSYGGAPGWGHTPAPPLLGRPCPGNR